MHHSAFTAIAVGLIAVALGVIAFATLTRPGLCEVRGKLTYKGVPIAAGTIGFHSTKVVTVASIMPDGTYSVMVAPGAYQVKVENRSAQAAPRIRVPAKYGDPSISGLVATVKGRTTTLDFDLAD